MVIAFMDVPIECDGIPDSDNDGWCDTIDPCPNTPGVNCPESDIDHDGVPDDEDDCPNDPGTSYYNGCPAPGEEDTDSDGVPDSYDHCPNQAGPASNHGCPLPENCLCKDDLGVKKLLSDLGIQEDLIQQEEDFIKKKTGEISDVGRKIIEAYKKESENDVWDYMIDIASTITTVGGAISTGGIYTLIGGSITLYRYYENHPVSTHQIRLYILKIENICQIVFHHKDILQYHKDLKGDFILQLRRKCPCAIENA